VTLKRLFLPLLIVVALIALYFYAMLSWSYSTGERAGWVQKLSHKGWLCKTWEGELAMVAMPGTMSEKFAFTVRDEAVADEIRKVMGRRVELHYEEKVGLPTTCFGDTRHFVTGVTLNEAGLTPGLVLPAFPSAAPASATP
jgi:hypothetical protein